MPLTAGTRLGPYEVIAQIGVGGMGEVYRATDSNLNRQVAIKVLPDSVAGDAERLARFQREAEVLAALNHPNIAQIHGLEKSTGTIALVMELVEGPTLADRIAQGAIPVDEALSTAKQIAEALEFAHEQGIIHRDLKPANVKVRPDGTVKVLDFGLAKALGPAGSSSPGISQSPTITTPAMTQAGTVLGTAAYMSPEQAKGRPADQRSDVWAFGAVLYEMLTGKRAFGREDVAETLADVMRVEPAWDALPPGLSPTVATFLKRCLRKEPKQRIPDMATMRLALDGAFETAVPQPVRESAGGQRPFWRRALPIASTVAFTAALVGGGTWVLGPRPPEPAQVAQFSIPVATGQVIGGLVRQAVAISADGTRLVYQTTSGMYLRSLTDLEARPIPGALGNSPVLSPDGESIVFHVNADSSLKRAPVIGGQPVTVAQVVDAPSGISWGEGGIVYGQGSDGVFRVSPNGGTPERLASVEAGQTAYGPQMLPGGESVLFTLANDTGPDRWDKAQIVVQSLSSGERRTLITGGSDARYLTSGHLIYVVGGTVFAVAFDARTRTTRGDPVPVIAGVRRSTAGATAASHLAVSGSGTLFFVPGPVTPSESGVLRTLVLADRTGKREPLAIPPRPFVRPRVSPDGKRLAVGIEEGNNADVWIHDLSGTSALRRLTFGGRNWAPVWSPDGRRVAFQSDRDGSPSIYAQAADGASVAERLTTAEQGASHVPDSWSADGRTLLFSEQRGGSHSLMALSVGEKRVDPFGGVQSLEPAHAVFSPDGRWVAYSFNQGSGGEVSPNRGVFVQPFPATGATYQVPKTRLDFHPTWGPAGREIYYVSTINADELTTVGVRTQGGVAFGSPMPLAGVPEPGIASGQPRGYDVLPDGRFIVLRPVDTANFGAPAEMRVILNWTEQLKRLVPTE